MTKLLKIFTVLFTAIGPVAMEAVNIPDPVLNTTNYDNATLLHQAASNKTNDAIAVIKYLVEAGLRVNAQDNYGWTPLHHAASGGIVDIIACLLGLGADPNAQDKKGNTPIHIAAHYAKLEALQYLFDYQKKK